MIWIKFELKRVPCAVPLPARFIQIGFNNDRNDDVGCSLEFLGSPFQTDHKLEQIGFICGANEGRWIHMKTHEGITQFAFESDFGLTQFQICRYKAPSLTYGCSEWETEWRNNWNCVIAGCRELRQAAPEMTRRQKHSTSGTKKLRFQNIPLRHGNAMHSVSHLCEPNWYLKCTDRPRNGLRTSNTYTYIYMKNRCYPRGADCWHFKLIDWISIYGENIFELLQCSHTRAFRVHGMRTNGVREAARWVWRGLLRNTIAAMCSHRMSCRRYAHMLALLLAALRIKKSFYFILLLSTFFNFGLLPQRGATAREASRALLYILNGLEFCVASTWFKMLLNRLYRLECHTRARCIRVRIDINGNNQCAVLSLVASKWYFFLSHK